MRVRWRTSVEDGVEAALPGHGRSTLAAVAVRWAHLALVRRQAVVAARARAHRVPQELGRRRQLLNVSALPSIICVRACGGVCDVCNRVCACVCVCVRVCHLKIVGRNGFDSGAVEDASVVDVHVGVIGAPPDDGRQVGVRLKVHLYVP
jgi:hypothetical protein